MMEKEQNNLYPAEINKDYLEYTEKQKEYGYLMPENWQKRYAYLCSLITQATRDGITHQEREVLRNQAIKAWKDVMEDLDTLEKNLKQKGLL